MTRYAILMSDAFDHSRPQNPFHADLVKRYGAVEWYITRKDKLLLAFACDHNITGREFLNWAYWDSPENKPYAFLLFGYNEEEQAYFRQMVTSYAAMELYTQKDEPLLPFVREFTLSMSSEDHEAAIAYLRGESASRWKYVPNEDGTWDKQRTEHE